MLRESYDQSAASHQLRGVQEPRRPIPGALAGTANGLRMGERCTIIAAIGEKPLRVTVQTEGRRSILSDFETEPADPKARSTSQSQSTQAADRRIDAPEPPGHSARPRTLAHVPWYAYFGLAAVLYLAIALFSVGKPLTQDQAMPVAYNAAAIADFGHAALGSNAYDYEISHPVLHQHLLGLLYDVLGKTTTTTRVLNLLCTLLVLFLIIQVCRETFSDGQGATIGGIAALLYALNPFVIQHSLIVD